MLRNIVNIDQEKCNGCGLCVSACHERAIILNEKGKAELIKEDYCDGLGDCLPACPMNAISIEKRDTVPYDEQAVKARIAKMNQENTIGRCPGTMAKILNEDKILKQEENIVENTLENINGDTEFSNLSHWPVQIRLAASKAEYFENADLLVAADCSAYAYGNFHNKFMKNRVTVVGCPKLDDYDYEEKFYEIFMNNTIRSVTLVRMEVPCCGGMERALLNALERCGKLIPKQVVILSLGGEILKYV